MILSYIGVAIVCILSLMIGYVLRGTVDRQEEEKLLLQGSMAYGLYEEGQVWNRIRVNKDGKVICGKE